jgi:hypothetical protein
MALVVTGYTALTLLFQEAEKRHIEAIKTLKI